MADYEFLSEQTVPDYIRQHPELAEKIDPDSLVSIREVGDGNLNLVFLVSDATGRGMCLKQALPYVRMTGEGWPMTPDRARHEVDSLRAHHVLTPALLPEVYLYDPQRYIIAMEDLSDHQVWRAALIAGERHEGVACAMGTYVGALAFGTSLFAMDREELAQAIAAAVNPQLCTITEDLVFSEPVAGSDRNSWLPGNQADAAEFQADSAMKHAMGWAKWQFMTNAEALIHGDLHTGSVMVRKPEGSTTCDSVRAFDSEFAFYGPVAFDLGALFANYVIAAARAFALGEDARAEWCLQLVAQTWSSFDAEFRRRWPARRDDRVWDEAFLERLLSKWRSEAWLFAAAKMSRRMIGAAKTRDIESLPENLRVGAVRGVLRLARLLVIEREQDSDLERLISLAGTTLAEARTN